MDQLPVNPRLSIGRLIAYFRTKETGKLNMGQVKEYMEFVEKNKEIHLKDIAEAIENYNAEKR